MRELARRGRRQRGRSRLLRRPADARAVGALPARAPRRLCGELRRAASRRCSAPIAAGDAVMVKGSLGSRMGPIVKALKRRYAARRRRRARARLTRCSTGWRSSPSTFTVLNVFRYITFRTGGAMVTALLFVFLFGPSIIDHAAPAAGQGPADPRGRAAVASRHQARHADHGRADDPVGRRRSRRCCGRTRPTAMSGSCSSSRSASG